MVSQSLYMRRDAGQVDTHDPVPASNSFHQRWLHAEEDQSGDKTVDRLMEEDVPLTLDDTLAVNLDVVATPLPEHDGPLEGVVESIFLPILDIVGELEMERSCQRRFVDGSLSRADSP